MMLQEKIFIVESLPLFAPLSIKEKQLIATSSVITEYKKGDIIYEEGAQPDAFYCVVTGRLRVFIRKSAQGPRDLEYLTRGKYVGIISLLTSEPHSVTVEALNDSIVLKIPKDDFAKILKRIPHLAIHFGQTLSRRLKRKDTYEKRIFESTIVSVWGTIGDIGTSTYAFNLALSLKIQADKKVILVEVGEKGITLESPLFNEEAISRAISKDSARVDTIYVKHDVGETKKLVSILSYLTQDYSYVLVDLPSYAGKGDLELLKQSDTIHILTASDSSDLHFTAHILSELKTPSADIARKIKVITSEYGRAKILDFANRRNILGHEIYATLPDMTGLNIKIEVPRMPIVTDYPNSEYSRAIRRISREVGGCLTGLALSSGAAFGLAHVGILKVIEREGITIDIVVGTSMGALIGALWASGRAASEIEKVVARFRRKIDALRLVDLTFPRRGLVKGREVRRFLRSQFGDMTFHDLMFPLKVVACDIENREEVVLESGSIVDAIMASIAIPGVFEPVTIDGRILVDGGIINPLPTNVLTRLGAAKIISSNALPSPNDIQHFKNKVTNIFDIIVNSFQASEYLLAEMSCQNSDVALHPVLPTADWFEFYKGSSLIRRGEEEAMKYLQQLKELVGM